MSTPDNSPDDTALAQRARQVLAALPLPDGGTLGASGRLSGISVQAGRVSAAIRIRPEEAAGFAPLRDRADADLRAVPGVAQAMVVLTADTPAPQQQPPKLSQATRPRPKVLPGVARVIAVASGKGGVGKSTTAVNLALGLRALGLTVGLLDADIYGPSLPTLLGLRGKPRMGADRRLLPMDAYGLKAMSMGLLVDEETAMVWRGPMVMSAITQMLAEVDWGTLDILLVDMPPGTGDAQLAIAQGTDLAGAVIVSTPQDLSLIDARRGITMFRKVDVPILGLVENMSHFLCPTCGAEHAIFGQGGARDEAARLGVPFLGAVPLTMDLRAASDAGQPVTARNPDGPLGRIYLDLARALRAELARQPAPSPVSPVPRHGGSTP
ncbi:Mrp/NBP35 family ATP-binding protein [Pararhodobacter sp. SW119]|uniref:Mrp/NBP35 family ATP-binding protein n=1 Tax=Pararhodobacter sp. SW119 TaxID=2780075 RepID=UPI001ADF2301|nr:Mrp/NBP35 family ATP-binding protein [Pararhodobacter sp. SW119]